MVRSFYVNIWSSATAVPENLLFPQMASTIWTHPEGSCTRPSVIWPLRAEAGRWSPVFMKTTCTESVRLVIAGLVSRAVNPTGPMVKGHGQTQSLSGVQRPRQVMIIRYFITAIVQKMIQGCFCRIWNDFLSQNPGYFDIPAQDVSVWHVPNNMELESWTASSILRYHTDNRFLTLHGGNLYNLFKVRETSTPFLGLKLSQNFFFVVKLQ